MRYGLKKRSAFLILLPNLEILNWIQYFFAYKKILCKNLFRNSFKKMLDIRSLCVNLEKKWINFLID